MKIKKEEVEHIADLARIDLTEPEKKQMAKELTKILDWVDQLAKVETKEIGVGLKADLSNVWGEDQIQPFAETKSLVDSFPEKEDRHLRVKGIK